MTHDDETVERVARALAEEMDLDADDYYARKLARTALSALPPRELLRDALSALDALLAEEMIYTGAITETLEASHMHPELAARARAAADKIRAALEHQQKGEPK